MFNIEMQSRLKDGTMAWGVVVRGVSESYARRRVDQLIATGQVARAVEWTNPPNA